jgi:hypothetical protein
MRRKSFSKLLSFFAPYLNLSMFGQGTPRHGPHSKRPESCKAELMAAAQAKRELRNAKRLAERQTNE